MMLAFWCWLALLAVVVAAVTTNHFRGSRHHGRRENANVGNGFIPPEESEEEPPTAEAETTTTPQSQSQSQQGTCDATGYSRFPYLGRDSAERLLLREGVIDSLPNSRCDNPERRKNVFLVVGDGMGWEMARAGAIARRVLDELKSLGCDTKVGCPNNTAAKEAFVGRTLDSYYTEGKGSGLSFQELENFALVTTSAIVAQSPNPGNYTAPLQSLLEGLVTDHETGMAPLATNECGYPVDFNPLDHATHGGNMVLWDNTKGGKYPWDERYYTPTEAADRSDGFDPTHIMQHAVDSAATATTLSTGQKVGNHMLAVNLYEEEVPTLVEEAIQCDMAAGAVTSMPVLHATPGAFISHSNNRWNRDQLQKNFLRVNPTLASGVCNGAYYPSAEVLQSMRDGKLSDSWTFLEQKENVLAKDFYNGTENLDPDNGDHILVCLGGDFSRRRREWLPSRGVDSSYSQNRCGTGQVQYETTVNGTAVPVGINPNSNLCNHYEQDEIERIPHITKNVQAAIDFLSKDDDGFFLLYEQGDIDKAAHENHMDDMLGTLLDINDSVRLIMDWIANNGGWEKNALYVTADHDHYLTLLPHFPEALANLLIDGRSHDITPENYSKVNAWQAIIHGGLLDLYPNRTQVDHIREFTTWTEEDLDNVGHFWGAEGSGGNGWGSHSARPVPLYYNGDDGCIEQLIGKGYQVLGREVQGAPDKIDQVHLHACMKKNLFGL